MTTIKVLDHGFVKLHNISGVSGSFGTDVDLDRDPAIVARMSFNNMDELRTPEQDERLCDYLMRNKHSSPFEMIEVWLEMKLPIFVARQFVRHRTVSINEVSGRYVTLPAEWYIPDVVGGKAANVKQGQSDNLPNDVQCSFRNALNEHCYIGYNLYKIAVSDGVAPEHARMLLSLNHYTHWMWKQNLHNLMHFMALRDHTHAQIEAQMYAQAIDKLIREVLPKTMALYDKHRKLT